MVVYCMRRGPGRHIFLSYRFYILTHVPFSTALFRYPVVGSVLATCVTLRPDVCMFSIITGS